MHDNIKDYVKAALTILLVGVSGAMLFIPAADEDVKAMFLLLTAIAVRDYFADRAEEKRLAAVKEAYDPTPPPAYIRGEDE